MLVKLTPNIGDILEPGAAGGRAAAPTASRSSTPIKSIIGVDLDRIVPAAARRQRVDQRRLLRPGGEADRAPHGRRARARPAASACPISGIGGISNWRDAAEFIALGATSVQVCTAVMHYGYRIVEDMIEGLSDYLDAQGHEER